LAGDFEIGLGVARPRSATMPSSTSTTSHESIERLQ
jgi:hypothetical protein